MSALRFTAVVWHQCNIYLLTKNIHWCILYIKCWRFPFLYVKMEINFSNFLDSFSWSQKWSVPYIFPEYNRRLGHRPGPSPGQRVDPAQRKWRNMCDSLQIVPAIKLMMQMNNSAVTQTCNLVANCIDQFPPMKI